MPTIADPHPELPTADDLVAYLDGELPPEECRRVEQRLAADAAYRQQLRELDQAWEALDALPSAKATDDFARTTMEVVTVAAESDVSNVAATAMALRRSRLFWALVAGAAAAALGFVLATALLPDPNRSLLRDLPVIRHADALQMVPSVEFLRRLHDVVPREDLLSDAKLALADQQQVSIESLEERRQWVDSQSVDQKSKLAVQARRFAELPRMEQDRLRALERAIREAEDRDVLHDTLIAYSHWLRGLTAGRLEQLREDISDRSVSEQVETVQQFVRQENAQASRELSKADVEILRRELLAIADERQAALLEEMRRRGESERARRFEGPRGRLIVLARELLRNGGDNETRRRLFNKLSPTAQDYFDSLDRRQRWVQLWRWIRDALQPEVSPQDLERFFAEKLDNDQQARLLNMPSDEMQARLERLYVAAEYGSGDAAEWWSELRDGRDFADDRPRDGFPRGHRGGGSPPGPGPDPGRPPMFNRERMPHGPGVPPRRGEGGIPEDHRPPHRRPPDGPPYPRP